MHRLVAVSCAVSCAAVVLGCSSPDAPAAREASLVLRFTVDAPVGGEQYTCFGFDASALAGHWVRGIAWTAPRPGAAVLHHATLYAVAEDYPAGPMTCDSMPSSSTVHIWAPGGDPLTLPAGVALALPATTRRLVVQTHSLRFLAGPPDTAAATIDATNVQPLHSAAWLSALGTVPALRPHLQDHTSTLCRAAAPMHLLRAWPHMHLLGTSFQGVVVRADGTRTVLVDVPSWNFGEQRTYPVDQELAAGDGIETDCTWFNPTDRYVFPGTTTHDEMCGDGLIVWPEETAAWKGVCQ